MLILFGLTLIILVFIQFSKSRGKNARTSSGQFWKKEHDSKFVPKKDLSSLDYITIPYASLPFCHFMPGPDAPVEIKSTASPLSVPTEFSDSTGEFSVLSDPSGNPVPQDSPVPGSSSYVRAPEHAAPLSEELANAEHELCTLAGKRILNLTGISNTELRLAYGTANLDPLTSYDQNYTILIRTLQKWGALLASAGKTDDAVTVLSYAVSIGSDIAGTYALLARLYKERGELSKIEELKSSAETLTTLMKPSILRDLEQITVQQ